MKVAGHTSVFQDIEAVRADEPKDLSKESLLGSNESRFSAKSAIKFAVVAVMVVVVLVLADLFLIANNKPTMRIDSAKLSFESSPTSDATLTIQGGLRSNSAFHTMEITTSQCELYSNEDGKSDHWLDMGSIHGTKVPASGADASAGSSLSFEFQNINFASLRRLLYNTAYNRPIGTTMRCAIDVNVYMYHTVTVSSRVLIDVQVLAPTAELANVVVTASAHVAGSKLYESVSTTEIDRTSLFEKKESTDVQPNSFHSVLQSFINRPKMNEFQVDTTLGNPFYQADSTDLINSFVVAVPALSVATTTLGDVPDSGRFVLSSTAFELELTLPTLHVQSDITLQCSDSFVAGEPSVALQTCEMGDPIQILNYYQKLFANRVHLSSDAVSNDFFTKLAGTHHSLQAEFSDVSSVNAQIEQRLSASHDRSASGPATATSLSAISPSALVPTSHAATQVGLMDPGLAPHGSCVSMDMDNAYVSFVCADLNPTSLKFRMNLLNETAMVMGGFMRSAWKKDHDHFEVWNEMGMRMVDGYNVTVHNTIFEDDDHSVKASLAVREQGKTRLNVDAGVHWEWNSDGDTLKHIALRSRMVDSGETDLRAKADVVLADGKFDATAMISNWTAEASGPYNFKNIGQWMLDASMLQVLEFGEPKLTAAVKAHMDDTGKVAIQASVRDAHADLLGSIDNAVTWHKPLTHSWDTDGHFNVSSVVHLPVADVEWNVMSLLDYEHSQYIGKVFYNGEQLVGGDGSFGHNEVMWWFSAREATLHFQGEKLGATAVNLMLDTSRSATGAVSVLFGEDSEGFATNAAITWSDAALFATEMDLAVLVNATIPTVGVFSTATHVNYDDQGYWATKFAMHEQGSGEVFLLSGRGRYKMGYSEWLLAVDEAFVRIEGNKLASVVTAMDFTNAHHGALRYKLLVRDGNDKALAKTNSSVTWTKPEHATWEEAGNFRVQSMLESFPTSSDGFGSRKLALVELESVPVCTSTTKVLDLSYQNLTELPNLSACTTLEILNIEGNKLSSLPDWLFDLSTLVELNAQNNNISSLNSHINKLDKLESLYLQDNKLVLVPETVGGLASLLELHLDGNRLTSLPGELGNLQTLQLLSVSSNGIYFLPYGLRHAKNLLFLYANDNPIYYFPYDFYTLTKLRVINVYNTEIGYFPDWVYSLLDLEILHYDNEPTLRCDETTTSFDLSYRGYYTFTLPSFEECTNLVTLDLSGNYLDDLPLSIFRLSKLTTLKLSSNRFLHLPTEIEALSALTQLSVSSNNLVDLPEEIGGLRNLLTLQVSGNRLTTLPYAIGQLTKLTTLEASSNRMYYLSFELGAATNLQRADLSYNSLTFLPTQIGQLVKLQSLSVNGNYRLVALPNEIGNLTALTYLYASSCMLKSLPASVTRLVKLEYLELSNNQISSLPNDIGKLVKLRELRLYSNRISVLPVSSGNLVLLEDLSVGGNQLTELPASIGHLVNVRRMDLSYNKLRSLPTSVGNLTSLYSLDMSYNPQLSKVPDEMYKLSKLSYLSMSSCNLSYISPRIGQLKQLYQLGLSDNQLTTLPSEIAQVPYFYYLDISRNKFSHVPPAIFNITQLTQLALSSNPIVHLPSQIAQLQQLYSLSLANCFLQSLPWEMTQLTNLRTLDISWNMLYQLPAVVFFIPKLEGLYAYSNRLTSLSPDIGAMKFLQYLNIDNNWLTSLPPHIGNMTRLYSISAGNNRLTSLPHELVNLPDLRYLYVSYNRIDYISPALFNKPGLYISFYGNPVYNDYYHYDDDYSVSVFTVLWWYISGFSEWAFNVGWNVNMQLDYGDNVYTAVLSESTASGKQNILIKSDGDYRKIDHQHRHIGTREIELHFQEELIGSVSGTMLVRTGDHEDIDVTVNGFVHDSDWVEVFAVNSTAMLQLSAPSNGTCSISGQADTTLIDLTGRVDYAGQTYNIQVGASDDDNLDEEFTGALRVPWFIPNLCHQPKQSTTKHPVAMPTALPPTVTTAPTVTSAPVVKPTAAPKPSATPVVSPTHAPMLAPSLSPSVVPSFMPTPKPTAPTVTPSLRPSRQPTIKPTSAPSTAAPTLNNNAPVITAVASTVQRSSIALTVTFDASSVYGGSVTCAAFANGTSITSNQQILTASRSMTIPYLAGTSSVSVSITGLSAMDVYNTYCIAVTLNGVSSFFADMKATKRTIETACCKTVSFTNSPAFVYGALNQYATAQPSQYVFSYLLSSVPRNTVAITPTLYNMDSSAVSSSVVAVSPATSAFTSNGNTLAGRFVLSAASSLSGSYKIILVPSGTSAAQYGNATVSVSVISTAAPKPAPTMTGAKFANNGGSLMISFSSSTNKASIVAQSFTCSQLLTFASDSTATCSWVNGASLRAVLATSGVAVGSPLTLKPALIKAECAAGQDCSAYVAAAQQSVTIAAPDVPVVPVVLLTTPTIVSSCDDVVIDPSLSTGSGGRAWSSVVWTVSKADALGAVAVPAVLTELNSRGLNIATPIVLARTLFAPSKYTLTLTLTNFLGQSSSATAIFGVDENPNLPIVSILGPSERSLSPVDTLNLYTTTTQASCAEKASTISYKWTVLENGAAVTKTSFSATPSRFSLLPYSLNVGSVYTFLFEATAKATENTDAITGRSTATVKIVSGAVVVAVIGGYNRQVATVGQMNIDASPSYDENVQSRVTTGLTFTWTCTYTTPSKYGESCASVMGVSTTSALVVDATLLDSSDLYAFQVVAKAADGRSALAVVTVQPQLAGSTTYTSINSLVAKINPDSRVSLNGVVRATYGLDCSWTAAVGGVNVPFTALTKTTETFSRVAVRNNFAFGLLVPGNTFVPGSIVTFRLRANFAGDNARYAAFSEIDIKVNAAPSGGSVDVSPPSGSALSTFFVVSTAGWTDDAEDFPLSYQFQYQTLATQPLLNLQIRSPANKVSANLPAGPSSSGNAIILVCTVYDASLAAATLSTTATVTENAAIDMTEYVNDQLSNFDSVGDVNTVGQLIANVGSTVNKVDCTLASDIFCASKNRASCSATPQTCSTCLDGFTGVPGDSNAMCFSTTRRKLAAVEVGGSCTADSDCLFGKCTGGKCVSPPKLCPSDTAGECSGHGSCKYTTRSGKLLNKVCTESDFECFAQCECTDGYGGRGCGLSATALSQQDSIRAALCNAVITVGNNSDPSVQLLESLIGYLDTAFDSKEVVSAESVAVCQGAMHFVGDLVLENEEMVKDMAQTKLDQLLKTASKFITRRPGTGTEEDKYLHQLMATLNEAILGSMVNGQAPYSYATQNMRTIISKARIGEVTSLVPPLTSEEAFYGGAGAIKSRSSYIEVVNTSTSSQFANSEGYMSMVVMLWGENPFHGASTVESALLRVENHNYNSAHRMLSSAQEVNEDAAEGGGRLLAAAEETDYYVVVQLNEHHAFDHSHSISEATALGLTNFTFPECTNFNGTGYEACAGCRVSTYTDYNVTFACSASAAAAGRRLSGGSGGSINQFGARFASPDAVTPTNDPDAGGLNNNVAVILGVVIGVVGFFSLLWLGFLLYYYLETGKGNVQKETTSYEGIVSAGDKSCEL